MKPAMDDENRSISEDQIDSCIEILSKLVKDTNQLFDLPESRRVALLTAAGLLSRPDREEFARRKKDAKKAAKRKQVERDKHARKETGIRSAREAAVFEAPVISPASGRS